MIMLMLAQIFTPTAGNWLHANYGSILANTCGLGGHTGIDTETELLKSSVDMATFLSWNETDEFYKLLEARLSTKG